MVSIYSVHILGYNHKAGALGKQSKTLRCSWPVRMVYLSLKVKGEFIKVGRPGLVFHRPTCHLSLLSIKNTLAINAPVRKGLVIFSLGKAHG